MNCRVRFTRISKYCLEVRFKHKLHLIWVYFMSIASLLILQSTRLSSQYYFLVLQKNGYNIGADTQYNAYCLFSKKDFNEMKIYFMIEIIIKKIFYLFYIIRSVYKVLWDQEKEYPIYKQSTKCSFYSDFFYHVYI